MKLSEALSLKRDLQVRIEQLTPRLVNNVIVEEKEKPAEDPQALKTEIAENIEQLRALSYRINATNMQVTYNGKSLMELIAERDMLNIHINILKEVFAAATTRGNRVKNAEIKDVVTVNIKGLRDKIDQKEVKLHMLDMEIQTLNYTNDLI